jgi:hypothetical protein
MTVKTNTLSPARKVPVAKGTARGILGGKYATKKQELMELVNTIRSTGAAVDVE